MSKSVVFWLAMLFMFSGAAVVWSALQLVQHRAQSQKSGSTVDLDKAPEGVDVLTSFELTERSGEKLSSEDLKGNVWVASFFYSSCPGACRLQNLEIMALQNQFADRGVKFVSVTCDPKTDTLEKLREYADSFQARKDVWYFLRGDITYVSRIGAEMFMVPVMEESHTERLIVVDKWGNLRGIYSWQNPLELAEMKTLLNQLADEQSPPENVSIVDTRNLARKTHVLEEEEEEEESVDVEQDQAQDAPAGAAATAADVN